MKKLNLDGIRELVEFMKRRWDPIILVLLYDGPRRRRELSQQVRDGSGEHIADGVLSEVLNRLQRDGLVVKERANATHVVYRATPAALNWVERLQRVSDLNAGREPSTPSSSQAIRLEGFSSERRSTALRTDVPHSARIWNYWLGGKDNFAVDRAVGDQVKQAFPDIVGIARASRGFLGRAVRFLAGDAGIRQFLDIGTGLPTAANTHQVAQRIAPDARVVYVDNDPLVLVYARALLTGTPTGSTAYIDADIRNTNSVLAGAAATLDFTKPIAVMMLGILGHITDFSEARAIVRRIVESLPSGSYLVVNDGTNVINPVARNEATRISIESGFPYISRSPREIAAYLEGLEVVEPGVVSSTRWRPDDPDHLPDEVDVFCGVGRKP